MLGDFWTNLISIIYPAQCLVCRQIVSGEIIVCQTCLDAIEKNLPPFCARCGCSLRQDVCLHGRKTNFHFNRAWSACRYRNISAELIHLFKYKGKIKLSNILSGILIDFIREFHLPLDTVDAIVPIPLHPAKLREREYNQSELISENISRAFKIRHSSNNLTRIYNRKAQVKLKASFRFMNMAGAFRLKDKQEFKGENVLLIDDVLTTGATCSEAAKTLKSYGAKNVFVLTFAS